MPVEDSTHLQVLAEILEKYYSLPELEDLCWGLNLDVENFQGRTRKTSLAREIVGHFRRRNQLDLLKEKIVKERPFVGDLLEHANGGKKDVGQKVVRGRNSLILVGAGFAILVLVVAGLYINKNLHTSSSLSYQVRVLDSTTNQPIQDVKITLEVPGGSILLPEYTDNEGVARFLIDSRYTNQPGRLLIEADAYEVRFYNMSINLNELPAIIRLTPAS